MDNYVNKKLSQASQQQRNDTQAGVNKMWDDTSSEFNLNAAFLLMVAQNIDNWRLLKTYKLNGNGNCPEYFFQLITIIECMLDFLAAKIKPEEEAAYVKNIELLLNKSASLFKTNGVGQMMYNKFEGRRLENELSQLFRDMLRRLDDTGMLTKRSTNPNEAIMEME